MDEVLLGWSQNHLHFGSFQNSSHCASNCKSRTVQGMSNFTLPSTSSLTDLGYDRLKSSVFEQLEISQWVFLGWNPLQVVSFSSWSPHISCRESNDTVWKVKFWRISSALAVIFPILRGILLVCKIAPFQPCRWCKQIKPRVSRPAEPASRTEWRTHLAVVGWQVFASKRFHLAVVVC